MVKVSMWCLPTTGGVLDITRGITASTGPLWGFKIRAVFFKSCVIFDTL